MLGYFETVDFDKRLDMLKSIVQDPHTLKYIPLAASVLLYSLAPVASPLTYLAAAVMYEFIHADKQVRHL